MSLNSLSDADATMELGDYDYELPEASIAQRPVEPRDLSRLLVVDRGGKALRDMRVRDLPTLLPRGALLVVNDTRVVPARLVGCKDTGGRVELLMTAPFADGSNSLCGQWALTRSSKPLRVGQIIHIDGSSGGAKARVTETAPAGLVAFDFDSASDLTDLLERCGRVPLPPYIRGGQEDASGSDAAAYQCVFAARRGAVAAPTAGLHLSTALLDSLAEAGVERCAITLHVGPGTFLPVRDDDLRGHRVLPERFEVSAESAERLQAARTDRRPVIAVGTTTTRTLETLAARFDGAPWRATAGHTDLTILPGHRFRGIDGLVSNFHMPRSSLLVLVASFVGRQRILAAYDHAVASGYRFYSYGDATLIC